MRSLDDRSATSCSQSISDNPAAEAVQKQLMLLSVCVSALLIMVTLAYLFTDPLEIKNDCAAYLYAGQRLLAGKLPYVDVVDMNPPLIIYLNVIPAWISRTLSAPSILVFDACICALAVLSIAASALVLSKNSKAVDWEIIGPMLVASAIFTFTTGIEFGQREHIAMLCYLPYFFVRWLRSEPQSKPSSKSIALLLGAAAGIGLSIKPYYFLPAVLAELYWVISKKLPLHRFIQPEIAGLVATSSIYAAHFLFLPNSVKAKFFGYVVPVITGGYSAYNCPPWTLWSFEGYRQFAALMVAVCVAGFLLRKSSSLISPLLLFTTGAVACWLIQHKGWGNHLFAAYFGVLLLSAVIFGLVSRFTFFAIHSLEWKSNPNMTLVAYCKKLSSAFLILTIALSATLLFLSAKVALHKMRPRQVTVNEALIRQQTSEGDAVAFFSPNVDAFPVLVQTNRPNGCRYPVGYPLTCLRYEENKRLSPREKSLVAQRIQTYASELKEDVVERKPKLIFVAKQLNYLTDMRELGVLDTMKPNYCKIKENDEFVVFKRI